MHRGLAVLTSAALASAAPPLLAQDGSYFWFTVSDSYTIGNALPDAFSAAEIQAVLNAICPDGAVANYRETVGTDGVKVFSAQCPSGYSVGNGYQSVDRLADGRLRLNPER